MTRLGLSDLQQSLDRHRAEVVVVRKHRAHAERVVAKVRARLIEQGGVDAIDALDRLSSDERYALAQRELS